MVSNLSAIFLMFIVPGSLLDNLAVAEPLKGNDVTRVKNGKYSYVVSIAYVNDNFLTEETHICTGVLITKKLVLTAAHCFDSMLLGEIRLIMGSIDLREGKRYYPSKWITYNQWAKIKNITKKYANNDIAIIKLSNKVDSEIAKPVPLSFKKHEDLHGKYVVLVGWGATKESPNETPRYLQEVEIPVLSNIICEKMVYEVLKQNVYISARYLCTKGEPHALIAPGDSGGPVLRKNSVVGISRSYCPQKVLCDLPGAVIDDYTINLHTSINYYREFITDMLKNY